MSQAEQADKSAATASTAAPGPAVTNKPSKPEAPASFPPPVRSTIHWLQDRFRQYYREQPPEPPERATRREYGYILWPKRPGPPPFVRHKAYRDGAALQADLARTGPHSAYYSTAYYRRPGELKMADKGWLGAELIFDLDADHLDEVEAAKDAGSEVPVARQLALVKEQFKRLLDEFLLGDFGLSERDLFITFSGGRGYHCHVTQPRLQSIDARARREIVDYVTGKVPAKRGTNEPDLSAFLRPRVVGVEGRGRFAKKQTTYDLAPSDAPGWPGRLTRGLVQALRTNVLQAEDPAVAKAWLTALDGIGDKSADEFLRRLDEPTLERIAQGHAFQGPVVLRICRQVLGQAALPLAKGETDEPVTADVKRLIRLPGSLHGKTGLRVVSLNRDELDDFDPLRDAVALGMEPVSITPRFDDAMTLGGETVHVTAGEATEVPTAHAVWWCARQAGTIIR